MIFFSSLPLLNIVLNILSPRATFELYQRVMMLVKVLLRLPSQPIAALQALMSQG